MSSSEVLYQCPELVNAESQKEPAQPDDDKAAAGGDGMVVSNEGAPTLNGALSTKGLLGAVSKGIAAAGQAGAGPSRPSVDAVAAPQGSRQARSAQRPAGAANVSGNGSTDGRC
mmetsp:Transcript_51786/g.119017  ORF Transcript_51786/g.119017 Transcript_51786/m.119017 type:complete len:114 (+) Transcript_51786:236-577(+)